MIWVLGLVVMKHARDEDVVDRLVEHAWAFQVLLRDEAGRAMVAYVLGYVLRENKKLSFKDLIEPLEAVFAPEEKRTMQSHKQILEQMVLEALKEDALRSAKEEGMQEGMQKGQREALQQTLKAQIRQRFGRLPRAAAVRIRAAQSDELSGWLQRILQVESVDELFARD